MSHNLLYAIHLPHVLTFTVVEMGATYEFRISAKNAVDFGEQAVETIRTPDGSELLNLARFIPLCAFLRSREAQVC